MAGRRSEINAGSLGRASERFARPEEWLDLLAFREAILDRHRELGEHFEVNDGLRKLHTECYLNDWWALELGDALYRFVHDL